MKEGETIKDPIWYKARFLGKDFTQVECAYYNKIFSPVVKYTTIRAMIVQVTQFDWELE